MVGVNFDPPPQLARDLLFVLYGLDHTRDGRAREAQEQDRLTRKQLVPCNVGRLENRDGGFAGAGPSRDKEVAARGDYLLLPFTELHPPVPPAWHRQLQRRLLPRYPRARACKPPSASCRRSATIRGSLPPCTAQKIGDAPGPLRPSEIFTQRRTGRGFGLRVSRQQVRGPFQKPHEARQGCIGRVL